MLQVFRIGVANVDRDVAQVAMAIHVCFKCMFQMFHLYQTYVARFSSGCCKSRSGCYVYMHIASVFFKYFRCFILLCASVSSGCCICLQWFSNVFQAFSQVFSDACFKCFICLLLYVATVAFGYFKSRLGVAHGMDVRGSAGPLLVRSLMSPTC